jgi:rhamnose transport system permease protein
MSAIPHAAPASHEIHGHGFLHRRLREVSVAGAYLLLLAVLALRQPDFFHQRFFTVWVAAAPVLVAAVGATLVILTREIDISIGSQYAVCAVLAGLLAKWGLPIWGVAIGAIVAGAILGSINGALVAGLGLPSIVVTLATMVVFRESLRWTTQGQFVSDLPAGFQWFGLSQHGGQWALIGVAAIVFGAFAMGLRWLAAGRTVYAVGSDREAARLAGIRPRRVLFTVFILMGALAGLAALLNAVRFTDVDPKTGSGFELQVIAAVVVGGVSISGGRGTLVGALIGVALLATIGPALAFFHVPTQWEKAFQGMIILLAVATDALYRRAD